MPQLTQELYCSKLLIASQLILAVTIHYSDMDSDNCTPVMDTGTQDYAMAEVDNIWYSGVMAR